MHAGHPNYLGRQPNLDIDKYEIKMDRDKNCERNERWKRLAKR